MQAHDEHGVVNMSIYSAADQLVTAGAGLFSLFHMTASHM